MIYNPHFYGGLSINHINNPDIRFTRSVDNTSSGLPLRLTLHAGSQITILMPNQAKVTSSSVLIFCIPGKTILANYWEVLMLA
jgi:hypothetical protein